MKLRKLVYLAPLLLASHLASETPAVGQDNSGMDQGSTDTDVRTPDLRRGQSGAPTLGEALEASQIRLSIINGLVESISNIKRARFTLEYSLLPGVDFQGSARRQRLRLAGDRMTVSGEDYMCGPQPVKIMLENEDLGNPSSWSLSDDEERCLKAVLGIKELSQLTSPELPSQRREPEAFTVNETDKALDLDADFNSFWLERSDNLSTESACRGSGYARKGCGRSFLNNLAQPNTENERISTEQFIGMLRDRAILRDLLRSRGIAYEIQITGEADITSPKLPDIPEPRFKDVTWELTINETLLVSRQGSGANERGPVSIFRVAAKATLGKKPFTISFRESGTDPSLSIAADFRSSFVTAGTSGQSLLTQLVTEPIAGVPVSDELPPTTQQLLTTLRDNNSPSQLDVVFSSLTGAPFGSLIVNGILGGTESTSIITGGLIGSDEVQALAGANLEFSSSKSLVPGVLLGVGPGGDESTLYIGPSIRASIFTLSAGARIFDDEGGTLIRAGGVISLDLSRATGSKKPQELILPNSAEGGGWGAVESLLISDLSENAAFVGIRATGSCKAINDNGAITLWQKTDVEGRAVPAAQRASITLPLDDESTIGPREDRLTLLPKGSYALQFPQGCTVQRPQGAIAPAQSIMSQSIPAPVSPKPKPSTDAAAISEAVESVAEALGGNSSLETTPPAATSSMNETSVQKEFDFTGGYNPFEIEVSDSI